MKYETFSPSEDLSAFIKCFWTLKGDEGAGEKQTIVPDGSMEIIFHKGDLYRQYSTDGSTLVQPRCFVIGQLTRPLEIAATGKTNIFAVRFHPYGFKPFSSWPLYHFENTAVSLEDVFGENGMSLENEVLSEHSHLQNILTVETFLIELLHQSNTADDIIESTIELIVKANGRHPVNELSNQIHISRRQLERKFSSKVGLSPKYLSRIIRLQSTLRQILSENYDSLTSLTYEEGYYDQAHLIREFKAFTGQTPKEYYSDNLKLSSLFYNDK